MVRTTMAVAAALAVLCLVQGTYAQMMVCDAKLRVGGIKSITMKSTKQTGSTSEITIGWPRPQDGPSGGMNSCISEYVVDVYDASNNAKIKSDTVKVSPVHTDAAFTATGLKPGNNYYFYVMGRNPTLGAMGNGAGLKSAAFKAAGETCRQPGQVYNIRREAAVNNGAKSTMTIAWNAPQGTPASCIKEYVINVYKKGQNAILKSTTVTAPTTRYTDNIYDAGQQYEFYIYARNPAAGAMGNGVGIKSEAFMAPVSITAGRRMM